MNKIAKTVGLLTLGIAIALITQGRTGAASLTLTLISSSSVSGPAGSTVGWGYKIVNNTSDWVETLNLTADVFTNGTPNSIFDFPVIAPFSTLTEGFTTVSEPGCPTPDCGLFEFMWASNPPIGSTNSGTFTITSELFATSPLTDPNAIDLGPAPNLTAAYSASVTAGPEPGTAVLLLFGVAGLTLRRKLRFVKLILRL